MTLRWTFSSLATADCLAPADNPPTHLIVQMVSSTHAFRFGYLGFRGNIAACEMKHRPCKPLFEALRQEINASTFRSGTQNYESRKKLQDSSRLTERLLEKWPKDPFLQLSTFHHVRNSPKSSHVREGDVVSMHNNWKRNGLTHVEKGLCRQGDQRL
ncbi:hypothetical protein AVEN_244258-2 [Araneus ventricosus]|uniref:DUF5641 domain-containing protein n=1 Tax=Araneus ventricosus TaxID=182803 RepID=A0A4Y2K212_ARAVE|nr:hypothetical protein AVEN_244258-2 [Araneus ventricosus]